MESKKRPHVEDFNEGSTKRRILSDEDGSPRPNIPAPDEPTDADNLEMFRKEAIYRKMKHYARENDRSQARITELERRKRSCEVGLAVMSACWSQLVDTIRSLTSSDDIPDIHVNSEKLFNITAKSSAEQEREIHSQLENSLIATRVLVTKLAQQSNHASKALNDEQLSHYRQGSKRLEAELQLSRSRVEELQARNDQLQDALHVAENRLERARSSTVAATQKRPLDMDVSTPKAESIDQVLKPSSPSHTSPPHANGRSPESSQALDDFKDKKIQEYEQEIIQLKSANQELQAREDFEYLDVDAVNTKVDEFAKKVEYISRPGASVESRLEQALSEVLARAHDVTTQPFKPDHKTLLSKRDADVARLRELRDQLSAELLDRKHKDISKYPSVQAYKNVLESRSARLSVLESQLKRCKARLASEAGLGDILELLGGAEASLVPELKRRLSSAETRCEELEKVIQDLEAAHPDVAHHVESAAALKRNLRDVSSRLDEYKRIFGELSSSPDSGQLADRKRNPLNTPMLNPLIQSTKTDAQLTSEVERLSNAWDQLDATIRCKLLDVAPFEDRLSKLTAERSKLENKFYAAMRERDAAEASRKSYEKAHEKLSGTLEKYNELLQASETAMSHIQKKNDALVAAVQSADASARVLDADIAKLKVQLEDRKRKLGETQGKVDYWEQFSRTKMQECRKQEEAVARLKKDLDKQAEKLKEATSSTQPSHSSSDEGYHQLKEILQCRICKTRIRDTVITKCMHTFCRECLDTRIATRQRKCPSCQLAFGHADVQPVYFQG
ncbi:hypothetical protein ONZ45_g968 [Pleurotus djamor]|nr:hypothetical protein ONZ45_g968 [Pleurotus djamor]